MNKVQKIRGITNACNKATEFGKALYDNVSVYLQLKYENLVN